MKIEERLRRQLHDTAELVPIRPEDYEQVVRRGRQRKMISATGGAAAAVVSVVAVIGVLTFNNPSPGPVGASTSTTVPPVTTTTVGTVPTTSSISNVVTAGPEGITIHDLASGNETLLLSDPLSETISWAVDDGAGGLVFVHEITPMPWAQGSIMWLPAGEKQPRPLLAPGRGELMVPLEMVDGEQTLILRYDTLNGSEIRALDLNTSASYPVVPAMDVMIDAAVDDIVVVVVTGGDCNALEFHFVTGGRIEDFSPLEGECLPSINAVGMADGFLYTIEDSANGRELIVRVVATGETVAIDIGDAWELQVAEDGTVAFGGEFITVGRFSEGSFEPLYRVANSVTFGLAGNLVVDGATLGSGDFSLPCTPLGESVALAPQDLPPAVEATRQQLFELAATCNLEALAELAVADDTIFALDGGADPFRYWVENARRGYDVPDWIVRILNTEPAFDENGYSWPAVFVTNTEEDWQAVSGTLSAEEFEMARAYGSYALFRLRIDTAGRWVAGLAGD